MHILGMILAFIFFLPLSEPTNGQHKAEEHKHKDEHKSVEIIVSGKARVYIDKYHGPVIEIWVLIKSADPAKKNQHQALIECNAPYPLDYFPKVLEQTCPYKIRLKNYDKDEKIEVGAKLDSGWIRRLELDKKPLTSKQQEVIWSKPILVPNKVGHTVNFLFDARPVPLLGIYLEGLIQVHIKGVVHLKLQKKKSLFFSNYYKVPDHVMVWIKPDLPVYHLAENHKGENLNRPTVIKSKTCTTQKSHPDTPHECHYEGTFYVREVGDKFKVTAKVQKAKLRYGPEAEYTPEQQVPLKASSDDGKFHVEMNFVLDFPKRTKPVIHLDNLANRKKDIHAAIVKKKTKKT